MAEDKPKPLKVTVIHGPQKYDVKLVVPPEEAGDALCVQHLLKEVFRLTQIPASAQRLIYKGKSLKDPNEELSVIGLKDGAKVMLLGKVPSEEDDETLMAIKDVENIVEKNDKKLNKMTYDLDAIHRGFLDKSLRLEALQKHQKNLKGMSESLLKLLEQLDALSCKDNKSAQTKRKSTVDRIQKMLKNCDDLLSGIDDLVENVS